MYYAVRTNDVFETRKPLKTRRDATPDQKRTRLFIVNPVDFIRLEEGEE